MHIYYPSIYAVKDKLDMATSLQYKKSNLFRVSDIVFLEEKFLVAVIL